MSYWKKKNWFLPIIGSLIALISLFTPTSYNYMYGVDLYLIWMNQLAIDVVPGDILMWIIYMEIVYQLEVDSNHWE
jgi:hypothetical protein